MPDLKAAAERRILELESELAVRDNMGNEVLRILREVTGKRDFHSEMEAAEWAARMILDLQTQLFLEQQSSKEAMSREAAAVSREIGLKAELAEVRKAAAGAPEEGALAAQIVWEAVLTGRQLSAHMNAPDAHEKWMKIASARFAILSAIDAAMEAK